MDGEKQDGTEGEVGELRSCRDKQGNLVGEEDVDGEEEGEVVECEQSRSAQCVICRTVGGVPRSKCQQEGPALPAEVVNYALPTFPLYATHTFPSPPALAAVFTDISQGLAVSS